MPSSTTTPRAEVTDPSAVSLASLSGGVSETMLLTLWGRAATAMKDHPVLNDREAVAAVRRIDFDFRGKFGRPSLDPAIRAKWSDSLLRDFLVRYPDAQVIALGDGLETQFWRVDNGRLHWFSVDLPEATSVRRQVLPAHPRNELVDASIVESEWLQIVSSSRPTIITANGVLMYLQPEDVIALLKTLASRFPGVDLLFDTVPEWLSRRAARGLKLNNSYKLPPLPFGIGIGDLAKLSAAASPLKIVSAQTYGEAFPSLTPVPALLSRWGYFRNRLSPALVHARLG